MKRVLVFSLAYYPHVGGAEVALKEITDRIPDIEFHLLTLNFGGDAKEEKIGNVLVHRMGNGASYLSKILFVPRAAVAAARLHREQPFDALWAMMSYMLFPIVLLRFCGIRAPYLLTLQEGDPWEHMFGRWFILPFRPLLSSGFKHASAVQAISTYLARWAKRMGYRGEVRVIPNGVGMVHFQNVQRQASHATTLVTTSRLVRKNAIDDVIRALTLLPDTVRFRIYGSGPDEEKLKQLARECGAEARIEFMGHIDHAELPRAFAECSIFIRPSRSEGMGNSFIEAMAAGLPVIATQEGGISDFLFDARRNPDKPTTGWAVDKDSPEQIAKAVKDILAHPEEIGRVTVAAKKLALEKYEWNLIAGSMRAVFDRLLGKSRNTIMRLVLATPLYPPDIGGPATYAKLLFEGLPAKGIEVELVKFSDVRRLPKIIRHYAYYRHVLKVAHRADAVLALDPVSVGLPAMYAAKRAGKPFVVKIVGDYAWEQGRQRFGITQNLDDFVATANVSFPAKMLRRVQTRVARSATRVIVPSEYLKNIVSAWGIQPKKIEVIYNAVSHDVPGTVPKSVKELPRPLVVTAGRLVPWKHIDGVIDAVANTSLISLVIIGDGPERVALARRAREKLPGRVIFTGRLSHKDTLAAVKHADIFMLNSSYEGLSHHLIEALALGTPAIATDIGGNPEVIEDSVNGLLVPEGDAHALSHALSRLLGDDELRARLSACARESTKRFSVETMLSATATLLKNL